MTRPVRNRPHVSVWIGWKLRRTESCSSESGPSDVAFHALGHHRGLDHMGADVRRWPSARSRWPAQHSVRGRLGARCAPDGTRTGPVRLALGAEQRTPGALPRLVGLTLVTLTGDYRAGMVLNACVLAAVAAAMVLVARRLRGGKRAMRTRSFR